jgi:hypothetical protein
MEAARDQVTANIGGKPRRISKLQATTMQLATKAAAGVPKGMGQFLDRVEEIEARAEAARSSEYAFSNADRKVIREVYQRLRPYDERVND